MKISTIVYGLLAIASQAPAAFALVRTRIPFAESIDPRIKNVVVLVMENRSFDSVFGRLKWDRINTKVDELTGNESNILANGQVVKVSKATNPAAGFDPNHEIAPVTEQIYGAVLLLLLLVQKRSLCDSFGQMLRLIVVSIVFPGGMAAEMALYEEDLPDLTRPGVDPLPYQQPLVLAIVMVFKSPAAVDRRTAASIRMGSNGTHSQEYHIPDAKYIRKDLLSWYSVNKRLLPWRHEWEPAKAKNTDWLAQRAYAVWVSEIMLQQTQVTTVVDSPGAQIVVSKFGGQLPTTAAALEKHIPGIGPYTAGAIASIAFNEHAPLVDGNVIRVLSRLCAIGSNPKQKHLKTAGHLLDPDMPGDFNQAMMDLGATVCTPKTPQCTVCPLKTHCLAFAEQEEYHALQYNMGHRKSLEKVIELYDGTDDRRVLVAKSPETGLLAGLWDFPIMIVSDVDPALNGLSKDSEKGLKGGLLSKAIDKLIYQYVGSVETILREDLGSVVHIFSHKKDNKNSILVK
ncbi:hypothetical protein BSLG_009763 [Batrachochytrium salamandrivorans]|nr:hypothetical protein BSLG_009763 [Batrachochytrium salamandrivorans]